MKKYFLWEAETLKHWRIPARTWDILEERQKKALSYLRESFDYRHRTTIKFLGITSEGTIFFEDGNMSWPILPPSLSDKLLKHACKLQINGEPALVPISKKEGEEIYRVHENEKNIILQKVLKLTPYRSFETYAPSA